MTHHRAARIAVALLFAAGCLLAVATPQASSAPAPTVGAEVAEALRLAVPTYARVDATGGPTGCLTTSAAPDPVVYRDDTIVLRSALTDPQILTRVNIGLGAVGGPGVAVAVERIAVPTRPVVAAGPAGAGGTDPVAAAPKAAPVRELPIVVVTIASEGTEPVRIVALARWLRSRVPPIEASPDYLLSPTPPVGMWPRGFATATDVVQKPRNANAGAGVDIWVYDGGLPTTTDSAWAPNLRRLTPLDVERLDVIAPNANVVDIYSGAHAVAIGDIIATVAPAATVAVARITDASGVATDVSAARRMAATLSATAAWPQIIVNAFGSPTCNGGTAAPGVDLAPVGLKAVADAVGRQDDVLLVASAGNRASQRRFYPAAFDTATSPVDDAVLGVGALDTTLAASGTPWTSRSRTAPLADFSNSGPWVEVWAPGVELTSRHVINLRFQATDPKILGQATISGTSFSAPYVAAMVADVVSLSPATNRLTSREAWRVLAASGRTCPAGGGGTALALTTMDSAATTTANGTPKEC